MHWQQWRSAERQSALTGVLLHGASACVARERESGFAGMKIILVIESLKKDR